MSDDLLSKLNHIVSRLALAPDVVATALVGDFNVLVLTADAPKYTNHDAWASGLDVSLDAPEARGDLSVRNDCIAGTPVKFFLWGTVVGAAGFDLQREG